MTPAPLNKITFQKVMPEALASAALAPYSLWNSDFTFEKGKVYMIEAPSGTGKSSLCSFISGLRADYAGKILFDGNDIRNFTPEQWCDLRKGAIGLMPQDMRLFPGLTVIENIKLKNSLTNHLSDSEIDSMLRALGIEEKKNTMCAKLSIGQQQRVAFIRALCQPFSFLFLDEPVSHLDSVNNRIMSAMALEHAGRQGASVVCTSVGSPLLLDSTRIIHVVL